MATATSPHGGWKECLAPLPGEAGVRHPAGGRRPDADQNSKPLAAYYFIVYV